MDSTICPTCGCRAYLDLTWEHCSIGFADCGTTLPDTRIRVCKRCGVMRVADYNVGRPDEDLPDTVTK